MNKLLGVSILYLSYLKKYKPIDRRHTDKHPGLIMTPLCSFPTLGKAKPLISTAMRQKFDLDI